MNKQQVSTLGATIAVTGVLCLAATSSSAALSSSAGALESGAVRSQQKPAGYQQILPRGRISSIDSPTYVPAAKAKIRDDAWVLGVVIDGQARAFSLDLLNAHEVVNDSIGDVNFAAVW